jgi:hypothetical protein
LKNVYHFVPTWLGLYLGRDPFTHPFNGKMSSFQVLFGKGSYVSTGFKKTYDPRPTELQTDLSGITGLDLKGKLVENVYNNDKPVYTVDLPPELLEGIEEFGISFWFRHSANSPVENPKWDDVYKRCQNLFRVRETEEGD